MMYGKRIFCVVIFFKNTATELVGVTVNCHLSSDGTALSSTQIDIPIQFPRLNPFPTDSVSRVRYQNFPD